MVWVVIAVRPEAGSRDLVQYLEMAGLGTQLFTATAATPAFAGITHRVVGT